MLKVIRTQAQNFGDKMSGENKKTDKKTDVVNKTGKTAKPEKQLKTNKTGKTAKPEKQSKTKKTKNDVVKDVAKKDKIVKNVDKTVSVAGPVKPIAVRFSKIYENKNVREILLKYFEEGCVDILSELNDYIGDEIVSNKKNMKAPIIRKWLNLMHDKSIVEFKRTKDKKTGWFTYFWKIRQDKVVEFTVSDINKEIEELEKKIEEIKAHNFICDCKTWTSTEALESDFMCQECEKVIIEKDNDELITEMENKKKLLEKKKDDILSSSRLKNM
ncbi:MAG: hypothetical protein QMD06_02085 [Candidatus Altarchaeum sp.]|nr:hypothetical protein [Candidatus Altarchaeum sp.]